MTRTVMAIAEVARGLREKLVMHLQSIETFVVGNPPPRMGWEDGYVIPPGEPGLGVELDEDVARAHPYEITALHLEMAPDPI